MSNITNQALVPTVAARADDESDDVFVFARNATEMAAAQTRLVQWSASRVATIDAELVDARENLRVAQESKWRAGPFQSLVKRLEKRREFYDKVRLALEAGYAIVPDMDVELIAIRTKRAQPRKKESIYVRDAARAKSELPPAGEGDYVAPAVRYDSEQRTETNSQGKEFERTHFWPSGEFDDVDFPFRLAKPAVLSATAEAMALKVFDEIGVLPRTRGSDPMIIGRVSLRQGWTTKSVNFVIAWFIDTKDL